MASTGGWFDRYVDSLPDKGWFKFLSTHVVVPYWVWREPKPKLPGGPRFSVQPSESVQRMMNLIMPLKDKSPIGRAKATLAIAQNVDEIFDGLDNVGTVHFARFLLLGDNICMISVYDGDFSNYIRDFIATIGSVFDAVMSRGGGRGSAHPHARQHRRFHRLGARARPVPGARFPDGSVHVAGCRKGRSAQRSVARTPFVAARTDPAIARKSQSFSGRGLSCLPRFFCRTGAPKIRIGLVSTTFNPDDIQGNILRGYHYERVRYLVLEVVDRAAARGFLAASAAGSSAEVPAITRATKWELTSRLHASTSA